MEACYFAEVMSEIVILLGSFEKKNLPLDSDLSSFLKRATLYIFGSAYNEY
jgi:hypothetical protein